MATVNLQAKPVQAAAGAANQAFGSFMPKQTPAPMQSIEPNQSVAPPQTVPTPSGAKQDISPMAEPPAVITTAKAKKKTTKNQQTLNAMIEAQKQAAEAAKQAPLPEVVQEKAVEPAPTKKIEQPISKFEQDSLKIENQLTEINKGMEAALQENIAQIDSFSQRMDEASQGQIAAIKAQFAIRKAQMADLNKRTLRGQTLLGVRSGRQRFAAEIQTGILAAEESAGIARLAELDAQEQSLIAEAESANTSEQFGVLNAKMGQIAKLQDKKRQAVLDLAALAKDRNDALAKEASAARDEIVFQNDLLEQRQVQEERSSKFTAPLLLGYDEEGNLIMPSFLEIQQIAEENGIDPAVLNMDVTAEAERLSKLDISNALSSLKLAQEIAKKNKALGGGGGGNGPSFSGDGDEKAGDGFFSKTQLAKGAIKADMTLNEFKELTIDQANPFINAPEEVEEKTFLEKLSDFNDGVVGMKKVDLSPEEAIKQITSQGGPLNEHELKIFKNVYTEEELKKAAKEAGFGKLLKSADTEMEEWLNSINK